jgi:hypothetical protein
MDNCPKLYRKRLIPEECVELKDDVVLRCDGDVIVTAWKALHPKRELSRGYSCYYLKRGIKVSKFISADGNLMYWYCDIVDYDWDQREHTALTRDGPACRRDRLSRRPPQGRRPRRAGRCFRPRPHRCRMSKKVPAQSAAGCWRSYTADSFRPSWNVRSKNSPSKTCHRDQ